MPRTFAKLYLSVWDDPDFLALTGDAQRLYLVLFSHKKLSLAGVLPLQPRQWALPKPLPNGLRHGLRHSYQLPTTNYHPRAGRTLRQTHRPPDQSLRPSERPRANDNGTLSSMPSSKPADGGTTR
jgi:hypothetical protein